MKTQILALTVVVFAGCNQPVDSNSINSGAVVTPVAQDTFVDDDPCGWDDAHVFHDTDMGLKYYYSKEWFTVAPDPETSIQFAVYADQTAFVKWTTDTGVYEVAATWERLDGCRIRLLDPDQSPVVTLANPVASNGALGGFTTVTLLDSNMEGIQDMTINFSLGHPGNW